MLTYQDSTLCLSFYYCSIPVAYLEYLTPGGDNPPFPPALYQERFVLVSVAQLIGVSTVHWKVVGWIPNHGIYSVGIHIGGN